MSALGGPAGGSRAANPSRAIVTDGRPGWSREGRHGWMEGVVTNRVVNRQRNGTMPCRGTPPLLPPPRHGAPPQAPQHLAGRPSRAFVDHKHCGEPRRGRLPVESGRWRRRRLYGRRCGRDGPGPSSDSEWGPLRPRRQAHSDPLRPRRLRDSPRARTTVTLWTDWEHGSGNRDGRVARVGKGGSSWAEDTVRQIARWTDKEAERFGGWRMGRDIR